MPTLTLDNSTTLHYTERGQGRKTVVLLHGFPLDGRMWDRVVPAPPAGVRIIAPDLTGFGKSKSNRPFTIESLADDLYHFVNKLNCCPFALGGFSMGGYVALAYAKKYPTDLSKLLLIDTRAEGDSDEGKEKRNAMIELVHQRGADAPEAVADQMLPVMLAKQNTGDTAMVSAARKIMESCSPRTIGHAAAAMRDRADQTEFLPSIACPTLIIVGRDDAITPVSAAESMQKAIPHSQVTIIENAGHLSAMEQPEKISQAIIGFVH